MFNTNFSGTVVADVISGYLENEQVKVQYKVQ